MKRIVFALLSLSLCASLASAQKVWTYTRTHTDTISTAAYSSGYCVGGLDSITIYGPPSSNTLILQSAKIIDSLKQNPAMFVTLSTIRFACGADHATNNITANQPGYQTAKFSLRVVPIDTWTNLGNMGIGTANNANTSFYVASFPCTVYYCWTTTGTPTWTSSTQVTSVLNFFVE